MPNITFISAPNAVHKHYNIQPSGLHGTAMQEVTPLQETTDNNEEEQNNE